MNSNQLEEQKGVWVYIRSEKLEGNWLYTVGFYDPAGKWHSDSDGTKEECAERVHYLNGGN
jgi:hypothetical protein